jgi:hypothetical protein
MSASAATRHTLLEIVAEACRAPSMYNAQPWAWRVTDDRLELHADLGRALPVADPANRNLVIGCGAALHHAQVAAAVRGWSTEVERLPDGPRGLRLAVLGFRPAPVTAEARRLAEALENRRTDRRRFSSWPVPEERLDHLAGLAEVWGAHAVPVHGEEQRQLLESLVERAMAVQAGDDRFAEEQRVWIDRTRVDGIPSVTVPRLLGTPASYRSRFGAGLLAQPDRELENQDGVIVLGGAGDDLGAWLRAGEALSAIWLTAVEAGLTALPLSQVAEVEETRQALREEVLDGALLPYLLLRVGWQASTRVPLAQTPRRPLSQVLLD